MGLTRATAVGLAEGRTLPKLVLSVCKRSKPPWMTLAAWCAREYQPDGVAAGPADCCQLLIEPASGAKRGQGGQAPPTRPPLGDG